MLALAEWIAPDFSIDGFWTYVGATIVVWLVNFVVGRGLDYVEGDRRRSTAASASPLARRALSRRHLVALGDQEAADRRVVRGDDGRLHLHRLQHEQRLARGTVSPGETRTRSTVPGIWAASVLSVATAPWLVRGDRRCPAAPRAAAATR